MGSFRVALAQMNPTVGDLRGNVSLALDFVEEARSQQADLVALPELALPGYPPEDLLLKPAFIRDTRAALDEVVAASRGIVVVVGFVDAAGGHIYNAAAVAYDGRLVDIYHKLKLPNYGVFDEERYFTPGRLCPVYEVRGAQVGVNVCEDIWYAVGPVSVQREAGAQLIVNINGSPYHAGKRRFRETMLATRAADNELFIAYVNLVGGQDELVFDGSSMVFGPGGDLLARAGQFREELLVADLELDAVFRRRLRGMRPRQETPPTAQAAGEPRWVHVSPDIDGAVRPSVAPHLREPLGPVAEVYQALVTGTRDYVRKNGFDKVLVSLSGGIDSSLTCCIAVDALGSERVVGVTMPSRYSSEGSTGDARTLAENLGIPLWLLPIEGAHRAFEETLAPYFGETEPGVAEQNVQSRIRGNLLMALSNKFGWLVLTTGNKSEMAVGYATLYGDMAGGFAVLKDAPKTLVYELSNWRNAHGEPRGAIPESVLIKPPSAELKPDQRDDDDLPSYDVLDRVLEGFVEEDLAYEEMVAQGLDPAVVARVMRDVDRNEFKRRQAPAGIKITPRAFGRDRRMPIVNRYKGF